METNNLPDGLSKRLDSHSSDDTLTAGNVSGAGQKVGAYRLIRVLGE
jgi:hypothetical protein